MHRCILLVGPNTLGRCMRLFAQQEVFRRIWRTEGILGFWAGVSLSLGLVVLFARWVSLFFALAALSHTIRLMTGRQILSFCLSLPLLSSPLWQIWRDFFRIATKSCLQC